MKKNMCKKGLSAIVFSFILSILATGNVLAGSWEKDASGWWYDIGDGTYPADSWYLVDGEWYCFDAEGYMRTGFVESNGKIYYCKSSGAMVTGWREIAGNWYYFGDSGEMIRNQWIGDYYVLSSGKMAVNQEIDGYWVGSDGRYITETQNIESSYKEESGVVNNWYDYETETEFVEAQPEASTLKITKHVPIAGEYDVGTTVPITGVIESNYPIRIVQVELKSTYLSTNTYSKLYQVNAKTVNLEDLDLSYFDTKNLQMSGAGYQFIISASDESGTTKQLIHDSFKMQYQRRLEKSLDQYKAIDETVSVGTDYRVHGIIRSNYPIWKVYITLKSLKDGTVLGNKIIEPRTYVFDLSEVADSFDFSALEEGRYHYQVSMKAGALSKTIINKRFEVK